MNKTCKKFDFQGLKTISGSTLKLIAVITMLIDHIGAFILAYVPLENQMINIGFGDGVSWYFICRTVGRTAFPIYAFLITEGYLHTSNKLKYGINLFAFALISEIPWNYSHTLSLKCISSQNVFFTLFFGYLGICCYEKFKGCAYKQVLAVALIFVFSSVFGADYGARGYALILVLFVLRESNLIKSIAGMGLLGASLKTGPAFILISLYNGERGFIKSKFLKYCFYAFYPVHLIVLAYFRKKYFG